MMIPNRSITPSASRILNLEPQAFLLVDPTGADNSVIFTAKARGSAGEAISIEYLTPSPPPYEVSVTGNAITFKPSTAFFGTTAAAVIFGINNDASASALVTASASGDVTGVVSTAVAAAFLALP